MPWYALVRWNVAGTKVGFPVRVGTFVAPPADEGDLFRSPRVEVDRLD